MNKALLLPLLLFSLWSTSIYTQDTASVSRDSIPLVAPSPQAIPSPHNLVARLNFLDFGRPNGAEPNVPISNGLEATYVYNINQWLNVGVPLKIGLANFPNTNTGKTVLMLDAIGQVAFNPSSTSSIIPYVFAGGGLLIEQFANFHLQIPAGIGVNIKAGNNSYISVQAEYRKAFVSDRDGFGLGFGWWFKLGTYDQPLDWPLEDMDADGIADSLDRCPDLFGEAATAGCPDIDGDLVADMDDQCPEEPGSKSLAGCPDSDNDGIADYKDACPEQAGIPDNNGCPPIDSDNDGITDDLDQCPNQPGPVAFNGCPDSDNDGVPDNQDQCPNQPGLPDNSGCPPKDSDNDGIADDLDQCPNQPGSPEMAGCPDTDRDGIPDNEDACPDQPGLLSMQGCPMQDSDRDGVADDQDECPDQPGPLATKGCPDSDNDSFADKDDLCPDQPGTQKGCPDKDGDGVADNMDNCPSTPGSALNYGCPDIAKADRERLSFAAHAVQFEQGKATLKAASYAVLDEVVAIMKKYPNYELFIRGHTDNTGSAQANQLLSEERAKACYEYLIARGIDPLRLRYEGIGSREPIADNSTEEGRSLNRRVEFKLIPKKRN